MSERQTLTVTVGINEPPVWNKSEEYHEGTLCLVDPRKEWTANVRFDGCIHLDRYYNGSFPSKDDSDYVHICDLDDFIVRMVAIRDEAKKHFGNWPG